MRDAWAHFDKGARRAIARSPKRGVAPGAVVAMIAVAIVPGVFARAPAAEAADTS